MIKKIKFMGVLFLFLVLLVSCGVKEQKERKISEKADTYKVENVFLNNDTIAQDLSKYIEDGFEYQKMKRQEAFYYILCEKEQQEVFFVLDKNAALTEIITFGKDASAKVEDFYIFEEQQGFCLLSAEEKDGLSILCYDEYDWEGNRIHHKELGETSISPEVSVSEAGCFLYDREIKTFRLFDRDGRIVWERQAGSLQPDKILIGEDGYFYVLVFGENAGILKLLRFHPETGDTEDEFETGLKFTDIVTLSWGRNEHEIFIYDQKKGVYCFDLKNKQTEELINWVDSGIIATGFSSVCAWQENNFLCLSDGAGNDAEAGLEGLQKLVPGEKIEKTVVTLGVFTADDYMVGMVNNFNRENEYVRIELRDYSECEDANMQIRLDIAAGDCPDILEAGLIDMESMISKDALVDLYSFMENDTQMHREQFIESILELLEYEEKLYIIPAGVNIECLVCDKKILKKENIKEKDCLEMGISLEELKKIQENDKEKVLLNYNSSQTGFLYKMMCAGKVERFFASGELEKEFSKLLQFSKGFPTAQESQFFAEQSAECYKMIKKGLLLFQETSLIDLQYNTAWYRYCYGNNGYAFIGYPTTEGSGIWLHLGSGDQYPCFGISAACENKEAAWEFVRSFLTEEEQQETRYAIPIRKSAFEKKLDEKQEIHDSRMYEKEMTLTEKEKEQYRELLESAEYFEMSYDTQSNLRNLVLEEAEAYFKDERTLEETVEIIKSRVGLFISEKG